MQILTERLVESVVDLICDVCNKSIVIELYSEKFEECGELKARWGCGSKENGNTYHLDFCESCFMVAAYALRDVQRCTHVR